MRRLFYPLFCLLLVLIHSAAIARDGGWNPRRGKKKKNNGGFVGNAILTLGPRYSKPDDPPSASQIPDAIRASDPNSPNSIAAQSLGLASGGNCDALKAQAAALMAQMNGYTAQLQAILAQVQYDEQQEAGCYYLDSACITSWANQGISDASKAIPIGAQAAAAAAQLQALQGQAATCGSSGGGQASAQPPAVTLGAVAKRFHVVLAGAPGGGNGPGPSTALEQLQQIEGQGQGADFDGSGGAVKLGKAITRYSAATRRAATLGPRVRAGRELSRSKESFDDPAEKAQSEYLKINYKELGPKYEALVQERHAAAENVADQALSSLGPNAPLPNTDMLPMIQLDESKATDLEGPGLNAATAWDSLKEGMKDAVVEKLPLQWQSLEKIGEIDQAVAKAWDLRGELSDALAELGSLSQSTAATEKLQASLSKYFGDVKDATFEKNPFKSFLSSN
jgi:hypothetical protein